VLPQREHILILLYKPNNAVPFAANSIAADGKQVANIYTRHLINKDRRLFFPKRQPEAIYHQLIS